MKNGHTSPKGDHKSTIDFLGKLRPGGPWVLTSIDPDTEAITTVTAKTGDEVGAFINQWNGKRNLYYSVNPTRKAMSKKATKKDIGAIDFLFVDLDPLDNQHVDDAKSRYLWLIEHHNPYPASTATIDSGNGIQALWRLATPITLDKGKGDAKTIKDVESRIANLTVDGFGGKAGTQNIDRILRLPGTINLPNAKKRKDGRVACQAKLLNFNGATCALNDFPLPPQDDAPQREQADDQGDDVTLNDDGNDRGLNEIEFGLPNELMKLIRDGVPEGERSDQFHHAVGWLKDKGVQLKTIIKILIRYPEGIASKYIPGKRVAKEARRAYNKVDDKKDSAIKSDKKSPLIYFDDAVAGNNSKSWIIKGVIAKGETSSWIGPPKSGKSGVFTDICICAASGKNWRGYRTKRKTGVVYFALERGDLVARRLRAYAQRDQLKNLPIAIKKGVIDLLDPKCIDYFVDASNEAAAHFGCDAGLIVIDTFSKGIADGGGDENQAKDQNRALANPRRVQEQTGVHVAIIHHTGKNEERGARGSNAHLGDVDAMIQISGKKNVKTAIVTDANDQAVGKLTKFEMQIIELGVDDDGDPIITAIVDKNDPIDLEDDQNSKALSGQVQLAFDLLLQNFYDGRGRPPPDDTTRGRKYPKQTKVCTLDEWKESCQRGGLTSSDDHKAFYKAFERAHQTLLAKHMIGELDKNVWVVGVVEPSKQR